MVDVPEHGAAATSEDSTRSQSIKEEPSTSIVSPTENQLHFSNKQGGTHRHLFRVKMDFKKSDKISSVTCTNPCTVLEAIKSDARCCQIYEKKKYSDSNIKIQMGKGNKEFVVATHFPCCKIPDDELLTLWDYKGHKQEKYKEKKIDRRLLSPDQYITFYIGTKRGDNATNKQLFTDNTLKKFMFLTVCEERDIDVKEALGRDGCFCDLGNFFLTDTANSETTFSWNQPIASLEGKKLQIGYDHGQADRGETPQKVQSKGKRAKKKDQRAEGEAAQTDEIQDKSKLNRQISDTQLEEIYQRLCEQFPDLKKWMESRFPGDSLPKALKLRQENFGKIQQAFAEVYRLRQLIERGQSVCKITVGSVCQGTGFVLVDQYVLTNAHLFIEYLDANGKLQPNIKVLAVFNDETSEQPTDVIPVKDISLLRWSENFDYFDYAVLELEAGDTAVPPGLLRYFDSPPKEGEACIIGHPDRGVKKMDLTWVIKENDRGESAENQVTGDEMMIMSIANQVNQLKIERILAGGDRAGQVVTYNTFMYHGASGSPVFDAHGRVFGLHTHGYWCECEQTQEKGSVIESAQRLDNIIKDLESQLKGKPNDLWWRIEEQLNPHQKRLLESDGPMEVDGV